MCIYTAHHLQETAYIVSTPIQSMLIQWQLPRSLLISMLLLGVLTIYTESCKQCAVCIHMNADSTERIAA